MNPVVIVRELTVETRHRERLLHEVSLEAAEGEVVAIVGASGSGKTTLAQAMLGSVAAGLRRVHGDVRVAGCDPFTSSGRRAVRGRAAAYLPQDPASALDPQRSVLGQLRTADRIAHPRGTRAERSRRVAQAMADAVLDPSLARRRPAQLSGGQAQRALLAWAYLIRPRLLILDEPTSGLDPDTAQQVARGFTGLSWRPAIVLVSHDPALVERFATRVLGMRRGRVIEHPRPSPAASAAPARARAETPPAPRRTALHAAGVTIRRGGAALLDGATLSLADGELVALRGRSGGGKTSLAHALCGHAVPAAGSLSVAGAVVPWSAERRLRERAPFIAYVPQDARAALNPHETVRRTLDRAARSAARRAEPAGRAGRARFSPEELLELVELPKDALSRRPDELSGGQRHRVALTRALAAEPAALVADEATAALDGASVDAVLGALDAYRRRTGAPVLLITHQDRVISRADRVIVLEHGSLAVERG